MSGDGTAPNTDHAARGRRWSWAVQMGWVTLAIVVAAALGAFIVGTEQQISPAETDWQPPREDDQPAGTEAPAAPSYREMPQRQLGPNAQWDNRLDKLAKAQEDLWQTQPQALPSNNNTPQAGERMKNRAYDGAPPTIPHGIDQRAVANCMACHEQGRKIGDRYASPMPHQAYQSCTQCHVPSENPELFEPQTPPTNTFSGKQPPKEGERAWPSAPPTIPHQTHMRENCMSCHGPRGNTAIRRTTHPWRQSCMQCHAPSAALDQQPLGESFFPSDGEQQEQYNAE